MSGSVKHGKEEIKRFITSQSDIKVICDVGCGEGTYPLLLGKGYEYIGIEIFEPYIAKFGLKKLYKQVIVGDIHELMLIQQVPKADCIIFGDVLEHLKKNKALYVLEKALEIYKHVIVSVPIGHYHAKIHYGNKYEAHISEWHTRDIKDLADWKQRFFIKQMGIFCI